MAAILEDGKLTLSGYVGEYYFDDGFTSSDVLTALAQIDAGSDLTVHINSPGGIATEGAAIHALLVARSGTTNVVIEGVAASAASLIAMAGETVIMSAGAVMMIHDPSGFTFGTSADHEKTREGLEALATAYARVYADKSGKTPEECRDIMREERWLTPQQAVDEGFADETTEKKAAPVAAFDYRAFEHAPKRLTALAARKKWSTQTMSAAPAASTRQQKEPSMSDDKNGGHTAADIQKATADTKARIKAIMTSPEAQGREEQAEHLAYETEMSVDDAVAILSKGSKATAAAGDPIDPQDDPKRYEASRATAAGLSGGKPAVAPRVDIVANMQRRFAVKG